MKVTEARRFFFIEGEGATDVFARENWRGGVLNRDKYGWHRMPQVLWEALRDASADSAWWICGYGVVGEVEPGAVSFAFDWNFFPTLPDNPVKTSTEWVAYNDSRTIAVLADFDVTIVGAYQPFADQIDRLLAMSDTSLRKLTRDDMGDENEWGFITALIKSAIK
jgi:hypothetical protein